MVERVTVVMAGVTAVGGGGGGTWVRGVTDRFSFSYLICD